jgi:Family of unknown function (DUF5670)
LFRFSSRDGAAAARDPHITSGTQNAPHPFVSANGSKKGWIKDMLWTILLVLLVLWLLGLIGGIGGSLIHLLLLVALVVLILQLITGRRAAV